MLYICTENERNLFSIENRPVGFYTECLLILVQAGARWVRCVHQLGLYFTPGDPL